MLLRKLTCGQLTGVIFSNPLSTFFRARSRPTLQGESFHNPSFSLLSSLDQDVPGLTLTNFQVLRRTMATLAQTKGGVKDVQGVLGHSKADTTVNVYMQEIEEGVKQTLDAIYAELTATSGGAEGG